LVKKFFGMDGYYFLPSSREKENLAIFDITTDEFVKLFVHRIDRFTYWKLTWGRYCH
jgi:hypothetical protein